MVDLVVVYRVVVAVVVVVVVVIDDDAFIVDRNIDVHIAALRKKLGPNFNWIETVRGVGYRLREESAKK